MQGQAFDATGVSGEDSQGVYLYCFSRPEIAVDELGVAGIGGRERIDLVPVTEVAALVSRVSLEEFNGPGAEVFLQDPDWLVPRACRHEQVIEAVMARSPVLPVRFGAVFSSRQVLEKLLIDRQKDISQFLDNIAGKEEWSVKGFLNVARAGEWLAATDPTLADRQRRLPEAPGARYFQNKRLQSDRQRQVKQWSQTVVDQVHEELQCRAPELRLLSLRGPDSTGREMVYHAAVLLSRCGVADFLAWMERMRDEHDEEGLALESSGPWPPYHFCPSLTEPS